MTLLDLILLMIALLLISFLVKFANQRGFIERPNPGIGFTWIIQILIKIFSGLFPQITTELRYQLERFLLDFYKKAMETDNPWDDFLARFLLRIFSIPIPN